MNSIQNKQYGQTGEFKANFLNKIANDSYDYIKKSFEETQEKINKLSEKQIEGIEEIVSNFQKRFDLVCEHLNQLLGKEKASKEDIDKWYGELTTISIEIEKYNNEKNDIIKKDKEYNQEKSKKIAVGVGIGAGAAGLAALIGILHKIFKK